MQFFSAGITTINAACCPHRTTFLSPAKAEGPNSVVEPGPLPVMPAIALHVIALRCDTVAPVPSRLYHKGHINDHRQDVNGPSHFTTPTMSEASDIS